MRITEEMIAEDEKRWNDRNIVAELGYCGKNICHRKSITNDDIRFYAYIMRKAHALLKEQDNCENCAIAIEDRQRVVRCKDCKHGKKHNINIIECTKAHDYNLEHQEFHHKNWFCADGEKDRCQITRPKETFWDSMSEADLMEPMHHFED